MAKTPTRHDAADFARRRSVDALNKSRTAAKRTATGLKSIRLEFKAALTAHDTKALLEAEKILGRLSTFADDAASQRSRQDAEQAQREALALTAVKRAFSGTDSMETCIALIYATGHWRFAHKDRDKATPSDKREADDFMRDGHAEALLSIAYRLSQGDAPTPAFEPTALELRTAFDAKLPDFQSRCAWLTKAVQDLVAG